MLHPKPRATLVNAVAARRTELPAAKSASREKPQDAACDDTLGGVAGALLPAPPPKLLLPKEVAALLGVGERTLERWRMTGEGPRFITLSRKTVRYAAQAVAEFVEARRGGTPRSRPEDRKERKPHDRKPRPPTRRAGLPTARAT